METDDENITTLLNMGFPDIGEIKHALKVAKNDLNEAVAFLTNDRSAPGFDSMDVQLDMDIEERPTTTANAFASGPQGFQSENTISEVDGNPLEFPTTNLYELQDRVFAESWSIPYKKDESLGKCLIAAARLAEEGLCDADENCKKFIDRCLPEAFKKLLTSVAVRRWCSEIQEGIFNMSDLLLDLVIARLKHNPVPEYMLCNVLKMVFDPDTEWNLKNKGRKSSGSWESNFTSSEPYACSPTGTLKEPYGWLVDLINRFAHKGGFELIKTKFENLEMQASAMAALLLPLGVCAEFLNTAKVCPFLLPCIDKAIVYVKALKDEDLKMKRIGSVSDLLHAVKLLSSQLWPSDVESIDTLLLEVILRMLKTPHFNARMNGLKEVDRLIDNANGKHLRTVLGAERIQDWLAENKVLSIVLEGNIDHVQYTDRIKLIVEFLGPRLSQDELTKIWKMQEGQNNQVVDNIYSLIAAASAKLNTVQFDHLFSLIQKSWGEENERTHGQLLSLIGKIGREAWPGKTSTKVLDLLWDLAHLPSLPTHLVEQALEEHTTILNDATFKDQVKKNYFIKCIEEIKKGSCVLPALKQLFNITRSIVKNNVNKQDKATLSDLNKAHEIVKLTTTSLVRCYKMSQAAAGENKLTALTVVDGRYTHAEYVNTHLSFLQFVLQEGDSYLPWNRCKDIWDTLVVNSDACEFDREVCCEWFSQGLRDLETDTQLQLFQQKLLKLDSAQMSSKMFHCFNTYFESVNINDHRLRRAVSSVVVEKLDLIGADYFWQVALCSPDETIANIAIDNILDLSYLNLAPRLKKDQVYLHRKFINDCYKRLEAAKMTVCGTALITAVSSATKTLTALAMSEMASIPLPSKPTTLQNIRRLLQVAERYISTVEELHPVPRSILPHGASFLGSPLHLRVTCSATKNEFSLMEHSNATLGSIRLKIAQQLKQNIDGIQIMCNDRILLSNKDQKLLCQLDIDDEQHLLVKPSGGSSTTLSTSSHGSAQVREVRDSLCLSEPEAGPSGASISASSSATPVSLSRQSYHMEQEKMLPGVVMAMGGQVFELLYQISELEDPRIITKVRSLLHLIPTDPSIQDALDALNDKETTRIRLGSASVDNSPAASPKTSPKKMNLGKEKESSRDFLKNLFDPSAPGMSPFRVLYNLEVLSGRLLPTTNDGGTIQSAKSFREEFLNAGGLDLVIKILQKDAMLPDTDYDIRQCCYFIALQLARFLLCGQTIGNLELSLSDSSRFSYKFRKSMSESGVPTGDTLGNISSAASRAIQTMGVLDFTDTVSCFLRVAWAAAVGKLHLVSTVQPIKESGMFSGGVAGRSRQSSTGSNTSTGSEGEQGVQANVCSNQKLISSKDFLIAKEALEFLVTCLQLRSKLLGTFYKINCVGDFIIDMLLGSSSVDVRTSACKQFCHLGQIKTVDDPSTISPRHFLLQVLLKAPLPLWVPTTNTRGASQRLLSQCTQYFEMLCYLLQNLPAIEQTNLHVDPTQMLEDEIAWLTNFTPSESSFKQDTDNAILAGHLRLMRTLFTCEGVNKAAIGRRLIPHLLNTFLFPASRLIVEGFQSSRKFDRDFNAVPKCLGTPFRTAAYELLVELSSDSADNAKLIIQLLLGVHHKCDPSLAKEFEYEPAVEGRAVCGYVGLKNAGATCYINSVIQQLYMIPGLWEAILAVDEEGSDDDVFNQFQMVLGHLLESKLQYYVPSQFWKCFKLWGQPVNVREQQDAFEFFTHLVDQVDEAIKKYEREPVFKGVFEGLFSDQKICQDCPHRYEREEAFMALNLTVKSHDLHDSLDQFVKGELLEGDNAYFCEKCGVKRNTVKRTCIKYLPGVLVIQLKRFGYDWEANRALKFDDHFKFPWILDMGPYTEAGIQAREKQLELKHNETGVGDGLAANSTLGSSSNLNTSSTPTQANYELVGIVVHSGQASAGHFYSYIKERRGTALTNSNKGKWFKFNDTTVEEFDMNDTSLEAECFGGTYKAKSYDSSNSYPETRHRYWNGYMLFYERVDDTTKAPRTPKRTLGRKSFRRPDRDSGPISTSTPRKLSSSGSGGGGSSTFGVAASDSDGLSQLTALVHHGEKQGLFTEKIPPRILRVIQEDNLRFFRNRDIYSEEYYNFVHQLVTCNVEQVKSSEFAEMSVVALELATNFLYNTYLRTRRRQKEVINQWVDSIEMLVNGCKAAALWLVDYLASEVGLIYIKPFLLECPVREVRIAFAKIIERTVQNFFHHGGDVTYKSLDNLIEYLLELLEKDLPDNCRTCTQYFWLISMYAQMGGKACSHLFMRKAFSRILIFLVGAAAVNEDSEYPLPRRWGSSQAREFSAVHCTLAVLVISCDLRPFRTQSLEDYADILSRVPYHANIPPPVEVQSVINGAVLMTYLREVVTAFREVNSPMTVVVDMLEQCSFCNQNFSDYLLNQIMLQVSSVSCNELKHLFDLLLKILMIEDPLQLERLRHAIDGFSNSKTGVQFDGMLAIIRNNHAVDSRRSYQCIKFLVHLANKSATAKDFLMQTPSKWQWAVNWLKKKMTEHSYWGSQSTTLSNEDPNAKSFQRTVSAQDTLAEATALLTELDYPDLEMDTDGFEVDEQDEEEREKTPNPSQRPPTPQLRFS